MNRWRIDPFYFPGSLILKNQKTLFLLLRNQELIATLLDKLLGKLLWITRTGWTSSQTVWGLLEITILIGWLDNHIIVLHHHELEKLVPASQQICISDATKTTVQLPFSLHIRVNNIQGRENQTKTPGKWGKKRLRIFP